ncbi:hypothetical protein BKA81DRAFT_155519 [Phyllosticta paracitricarpa]
MVPQFPATRELSTLCHKPLDKPAANSQRAIDGPPTNQLTRKTTPHAKTGNGEAQDLACSLPSLLFPSLPPTHACTHRRTEQGQGRCRAGRQAGRPSLPPRPPCRRAAAPSRPSQSGTVDREEAQGQEEVTNGCLGAAWRVRCGPITEVGRGARGGAFFLAWKIGKLRQEVLGFKRRPSESPVR